VRNVTGLGLKESKEIVDNAPKRSKKEQVKKKVKLSRKKAVGGKVTVK
jgi:ribosomal protein L7/L12